MTLAGYLEAVEPFQVRGWACDRARPQHVLVVEILLRDQVMGAVHANLYRPDLKQDRVGDGRHAFIFNVPQRLDPSEIPSVSARIVLDDGSFKDLPSLPDRPRVVAPAAADEPLFSYDVLTSDPDKRPVFVLGAARSGTSAMAQALLKLDRFQGHHEGHFLDLLAHLSVSLSKFYQEKWAEFAPGRNTTIARVPRDFFQESLDDLFIRTARSLFPGGAWIDKTPNSNMIHLAPRLRRLWPNGRFIFMRRRFLENAASRKVKFPDYNFGQNCRQWGEAMTAWLSVRDQLKGAAIEMDQRFLERNPEEAAEAVAKFLKLKAGERDVVGQALAFDHPERTSDIRETGLEIADMEWRPDQIEEFDRICADAMKAFGYSTGADYYHSGNETNGLVWL